jgi:D-glycero-D-manno-heptose 1,7-bisphosphate phosphatase
MQRAIFLDRDGVINRALVRDGKPYPPLRLEELEIIPGVSDSLNRLHDAGFFLVVVTNQPDVSRGISKRIDVEAINQFLSICLPLDDFRTCYHDTSHGCLCRKPLPGSILAAAMDHQIDLSKSFMIGDRWRDIYAGHAAGCKTFFINYGYDEKQPKNPDFIVSSLMDAEKIILRDFL